MVCVHPEHRLGDISCDNRDRFEQHLIDIALELDAEGFREKLYGLLVQDFRETPNKEGLYTVLLSGEHLEGTREFIEEQIEDTLEEIMFRRPDNRTTRVAREIIKDKSVTLPFYLYDHRQLAIFTSPFEDRWDSSLLGFIYVPKFVVEKKFGLCEEAESKAKQALEAEVMRYNAYIGQAVFGYRLFKKGEEIQAKWGIYGVDELLKTLRHSLPAEYHHLLDTIVEE